MGVLQESIYLIFKTTDNLRLYLKFVLINKYAAKVLVEMKCRILINNLSF